MIFLYDHCWQLQRKHYIGMTVKLRLHSCLVKMLKVLNQMQKYLAV